MSKRQLSQSTQVTKFASKTVLGVATPGAHMQLRRCGAPIVRNELCIARFHMELASARAGLVTGTSSLPSKVPSCRQEVSEHLRNAQVLPALTTAYDAVMDSRSVCCKARASQVERMNKQLLTSTITSSRRIFTW
jgi:hypothetical protein